MKYKFVVALALLATSAFARDGWQDRPRVCDMPSGPRWETCNAWISRVQRPDLRGSSCCGEADSYIVDDFRRDENGNLIAIISIDYPPLSGYEGSAPPGGGMKRGTEILIPPDKINWLAEDANRSGHGAVFLMPGTGTVLCFFFPPLI